MVNNANRAMFDQEVQEPYRKISLLSDLIGGYGSVGDDESPSAGTIDESNKRT